MKSSTDAKADTTPGTKSRTDAKADTTAGTKGRSETKTDTTPGAKSRANVKADTTPGAKSRTHTKDDTTAGTKSRTERMMSRTDAKANTTAVLNCSTTVTKDQIVLLLASAAVQTHRSKQFLYHPRHKGSSLVEFAYGQSPNWLLRVGYGLRFKPHGYGWS